MVVSHTRTKPATWVARFIASFAAVVVAWFAVTGLAVAAVEVNSADQSQLEGVKGIGPALSSKILAARKQGSFKDWSDLQARVSGIGEKNSAGLSRNGLTVAGHAKDGAQAAPDAGRTAKASGKKTATDGPGTTVAANAKK